MLRFVPLKSKEIVDRCVGGQVFGVAFPGRHLELVDPDYLAVIGNHISFSLIHHFDDTVPLAPVVRWSMKKDAMHRCALVFLDDWMKEQPFSIHGRAKVFRCVLWIITLNLFKEKLHKFSSEWIQSSTNACDAHVY